MSGFIRGFRSVFRGFGLITKPGIRVYVLVPLLINLALFSLGILASVHLLEKFIDSFLSGWWEWLQWILWPLFAVITLAIVFFGFAIMASLLSAPFNGFLAEATERHLDSDSAQAPESMGTIVAEINKALISEVKKFTYFAVRAVPLGLLFLVPGINIVAPFLWLLFGAWMLSLEYADFPMANHNILFPEIRQIMSTNKSLAFGFGLGLMLLISIPVLNFIAIPVGVCAATILWVENLKIQRNGNTSDTTENS